MEIKGEHRIPASRQAVWDGLNDPEILRQCIPGCESLEKTSDTQFQGTVRTKVGPVRAKFQGSVTLSDLDPPNGYTISGEGKGASAGFAKGAARVNLTEDGDETLLRYDVDATVGGKLAQVGARLIDGTVKKLSGEFFEKFSEVVANGQGADTAATTDAAAPPETAAASQGPAQPGPAEPAAAPDRATPDQVSEVSAISPSAASAQPGGPDRAERSTPSVPPTPPPGSGLHPAVWAVGAIVIVGVLLWVFAGN